MSADYSGGPNPSRVYVGRSSQQPSLGVGNSASVVVTLQRPLPRNWDPMTMAVSLTVYETTDSGTDLNPHLVSPFTLSTFTVRVWNNEGTASGAYFVSMLVVDFGDAL